MKTWMTEYSKQLTRLITEDPQAYCWPASELPSVLAKMRVAFHNRNYDKDGGAVKATCKALGIKHTYTAINHFIDNHV